jgi:hypothetical protein
MGVTAAVGRASAVLEAVAARRATAPTAGVDKQAGAKAAQTALLTVAQEVAVSAVSAVPAAMAVTLWCLKPTKRRFPSARPAEQASRASQGVVVAVVVAGLVRCSSPVVVAAAQVLVVPQAVELLVAVVAAGRSACMLSMWVAW